MTKSPTYFEATLKALGLPDHQLVAARANASELANAIIAAFGQQANGLLIQNRAVDKRTTGLIYGRIQSGKTRAMISTTALLFDRGFRISIVMTSNINDFVSQTHLDFARALPGVTTFMKDSDFDGEIPGAKINLEKSNGRLLLICSKGAQSLTNVSKFLSAISATRYPTVIFDDEGDQASLDTNTRRRARALVAVAPSSINGIIQNKLRVAAPRHVYVGVTGTPQSVLLQSVDSQNCPSFIKLLPAGSGYVGGDVFFGADEPEESGGLIDIVDQNEQALLLGSGGAELVGFRRSVLFFLVAAANAIKHQGTRPQGYSYLCHPSLKNNEQHLAEKCLRDLLDTFWRDVCEGPSTEVRSELNQAIDTLKKTLLANCLSLDEILEIVKSLLPTKKILVVNNTTKRLGIEYGAGLNFLIGGSTLGRGIAIKDLLVTYYIRTTRTSQIDTMHQHARMYGYRASNLPYARLFIIRESYYKFQDIYQSDKDLRDFVESNLANPPGTFPIEVVPGIRATRTSVLDVNHVGTIRPGMHLFPDRVILRRDDDQLKRLRRKLRVLLEAPTESDENVAASSGRRINFSDALSLVGMIKTRSRNSWRDSTIRNVIRKVAEQMGGEVELMFRTAERAIGPDGYISTGTLAGEALMRARRTSLPTL
jgi:hypothetical protein